MITRIFFCKSKKKIRGTYSVPDFFRRKKTDIGEIDAVLNLREKAGSGRILGSLPIAAARAAHTIAARERHEREGTLRP